MEKPDKKLDVWQVAMAVAKTVYDLTRHFSEEERCGLVSQMRRAAVSIPCNIAERAARQGTKEFRNFLSMAQGSLSELDTQLEISLMLGYLCREEIQEPWNQLMRVDKMLTSLIRSLSKSPANG